MMRNSRIRISRRMAHFLRLMKKVESKLGTPVPEPLAVKLWQLAVNRKSYPGYRTMLEQGWLSSGPLGLSVIKQPNKNEVMQSSAETKKIPDKLFQQQIVPYLSNNQTENKLPEP